MQPRTGGTNHGFICIGWIGLRPFGQPNLNVQAGLRTADDDMSHPSMLMRLRREDLICLNASNHWGEFDDQTTPSVKSSVALRPEPDIISYQR
jgi:hypothetical protein